MNENINDVNNFKNYKIKDKTKKVKDYTKVIENILTNYFDNMIEYDEDYIKKENELYSVFRKIEKSGFFNNNFLDMPIEFQSKYTKLLINKISEFLARQFLLNLDFIENLKDN